MWSKKDKCDYSNMGDFNESKTNNSYFDDSTGKRTPIQNKLRKNNNSIRGVISMILILVIGSVIYNVAQREDISDDTSVSTNKPPVSKKYEEVDSYLTKFYDFSMESYEFMDEVVAIYNESEYSPERIAKLETLGIKMDEYDFSTFTSSKYSKVNSNVNSIKSCIKECITLIKSADSSGVDIDQLINIVESYDKINGEYTTDIIDLLEESGIRYEKTEDGGVNYWPY